MKAAVRRRARIARVRRIEHANAAASAAAAEQRVTTLEQQSQYLGRLASDITPGSGSMIGATLANAGQLAQRLRNARDGLADAITGAKAVAFEQSLARIEARIRQESADRLEVQAQDKVEAAIDRRFAAIARAGFRGSRLGESD